jgi:hypothetical protein
MALEADLQKLAKLPENRRCANCDVENRCVSGAARARQRPRPACARREL